MSMTQTPPENLATTPTATPTWMRALLIIAGIYNLLWDAFVVLFPLTLFQMANMDLPR